MKRGTRLLNDYEFDYDTGICKLLLASKTYGNMEFLIDIADYPLVKDYTWEAAKRRACFYVQTSVQRPDDSRTCLYLHKILLPAEGRLVVDHINGDALDNRRANLRLVTNQQNILNRRKPTKGYYYYEGKPKPWRVLLRTNGRLDSFGYYRTEEEAAAIVRGLVTQRELEFGI